MQKIIFIFITLITMNSNANGSVGKFVECYEGKSEERVIAELPFLVEDTIQRTVMIYESQDVPSKLVIHVSETDSNGKDHFMSEKSDLNKPVRISINHPHGKSLDLRCQIVAY